MTGAPGAPERQRRWLMPEPDRSLPVRLFSFPHAGAGAGSYRTWVEPLRTSGVAVCSVQLPGRETRFGEPPYTRLEPLLDALVPALAPYLDVPFALFGHSLGALLAFALTHALRAHGLPQPLELHVSGRVAPQRTDPDRRLHELSERELVAELRALGGLPRAVLDDPGLLALQLKVLRADLAINETHGYAPEPPLDVPITAWAGAADPVADEPSMRAWAQQTRRRFRARTLPGGHFFVSTASGELLALLAADLQVAHAGLGSGRAAVGSAA